jgi:DNA sulfur modification protein DndB
MKGCDDEVTTVQLSNPQKMVTYTIKELITMMENNQITLRDVNLPQVRALKKYIFENALNEKIYLPPIVANVEDEGFQYKKPERIQIIDGTKRLMALAKMPQMIGQALDNLDEKRAFMVSHLLEETSIAVQVFDRLTSDECDQLFIDFNTKGKKVSLSKRIAYDSRNEMNDITNQLLLHNSELKTAGIEMEKRAVIKPNNQNLMSLSQLRQIVGIFITGDIFYKLPEDKIKGVLSNHDYVSLINIWFEELFRIYPSRTIGDYNQTMLASFPMLVAIACYINKGASGKEFQVRRELIEQRMRRLSKIDWGTLNPIWQQFKGSRKGRKKLFFLSNDKQTIKHIVAWLNDENEGR